MEEGGPRAVRGERGIFGPVAAMAVAATSAGESIRCSRPHTGLRDQIAVQRRNGLPHLGGLGIALWGDGPDIQCAHFNGIGGQFTRSQWMGHG